MAMTSVLSLAKAAQRKRRRDVLRWARRCGFTPRMSLDDPDTIVDFIGRCIELYPEEFTHAHGTEVFAWCMETAPWRDGVTTSGGPEAA
jgi:hypothetical protein